MEMIRYNYFMYFVGVIEDSLKQKVFLRSEPKVEDVKDLPPSDAPSSTGPAIINKFLILGVK